LLATLNTLLEEAPATATATRILWHDDGDAPAVTLRRLQRDVAALRHKLAGVPARRWLLHSDDPCDFLSGFLALLGLRRQIVICASAKPAWLTGLNGAFDAILSATSLAIPDSAAASAGTQPQRCKPCVDFSTTGREPDHWQPVFDGSEEIVFFTSGSTGQPKAVPKTLLALTNEVGTLQATFGTTLQHCVFLASVSHLHIYGLLFRVLLPVLLGAASIRRQVEYPEQLAQLTGKVRGTGIAQDFVFISSPTFLSHLDPRLPAVPMAAVFSSGGPLSFAAAQQACAYCAVLPIEVYGSTETGGIGYRQQSSAATPWTPFAGVALVSAEDGVRLTSPNMPGQPPYPLDDALDFSGDGRFTLQGRRDRIVKIAEKRISLTEIERILEALPTIRRCATLQVGDRLGCAVVLSETGAAQIALSGQRVLVQHWKSALRQRFDAVVIPRQWRVVAELPVNSQSKLDSVQLLSEFAAHGEPQ
jgi:acyl-coenzyme A synthetase/AMP-(fatty) acid ligase